MNTLIENVEPWLYAIIALSWKGALFTLAVGLVIGVLRRHLSPAWRHGLWLLVLLRFAAPDMGTSAVSLTGFAKVPERLAPAPVELPENILFPGESLTAEVSMPAPNVSTMLPQMPHVTPSPPPVPVVYPTRWWSLTDLLALGWVIGMMGISSGMVFLHLRLLYRIRRDSTPANEEITDSLHAACKLAGVTTPPRLIITDAVPAPALFGIVRPVILLPRELAVQGPSAALRLIFLHELAHLQRRDLWAQVAASLIVVLHWFNPVVWIAARRMRAEAEMAADAHALLNTDVSTEAHRLGEVLLGFAHRATAGWLVWFVTSTLLGISENKRDLKRRIEALMDIAKGRRTRWVVGLGVFMLLAVIGLTKAPAEDTKKPTSPEAKKKAVEVTVSGTITRKADGQPIKDAEVSVGLDLRTTLQDTPDIPFIVYSSKGTTKTDASGRYRVTATHLGAKAKATVMINAPGMKVITHRFSSSEENVDHALEPDEGLTGRVVNAAGQSVHRARVSLESSLAMLAPSTRIPSDKFNRTLMGYWIGQPETNESGIFSGKLLDQTTKDKFWLVIHHPTQGFQKLRLTDFKPGAAIQLSPWSIVHGRLTDPEGNPIRGAELKFLRSDFEKDATGKIVLSTTQSMTCKTDNEGRYKVDQILPGLGSSSVSLNNKTLHMNLGPHQAGEAQELDLRQPAIVPARQMRDVTGRIVLPAGYTVRSDKHEIHVDLRIVGTMEVHRMNEPDDEGRFWARPQPPGDYMLRIWVQPKDRKLANSYERGLSMPFKLTLESDNAALQLGEFKLEAADFVFKPASPTPTTPAKNREQRLDAPVADAATFATWAGSSGSGLGPESPLTAEGRIVGISAASSMHRFMIRATKADGTHYYSEMLLGTEDKAYTDKLTFTPGVAVEGQMYDLPSDYSGGGWAVAAVRVEQRLEPGKLTQGGIPFVLWHAWTPVLKDGHYHFKSLPRGALTLVGFGDGWTTRNSGNSSLEITANLMGSETRIVLPADTKRSFQKRVQLLHPDGSPAAGATISVASISSTHLNRAWGRWGHATEPEDAEAYARYKKQPIAGHLATTDTEGHATLSNQLYQSFYSNKTTCEVKWIDAKTKATHVEKVDIQIGSKETQVVKLTGKPSL